MFSMIEVKNQTISENILKTLRKAFIEGEIDFDIINSLKQHNDMKFNSQQIADLRNRLVKTSNYAQLLKFYENFSHWYKDKEFSFIFLKLDDEIAYLKK